MQYDFRSIYATIMQHWFCLDKTVVDGLFPAGVNGQLQDLPLFKNNITCNTGGGGNTNPQYDKLISNYPNPFTNNTTITFQTDGGHTLVQVFDTAGRLIQNVLERDYPAAGTYTVNFDASHLPYGVYYARLQNGPVQKVRPMLKVR
jgi:hypothetical protein